MAKISKAPEQGDQYPARLTLLFFLATAAVYLFGLWLPLLGPDEPRYAQVAREMFLRGDWVSTTLGGFNWFEKPSLLYWLQISAYHVFGVNEFAARLGSATFGLGTVVSLYLLGRGMGNEARRNGLPFWLTAVSATSIGLMVFSRGASFDIIITFPLTAALAAFFLWYRAAESGSTPRRRSFLLFTFYFFCGVALLAKGLIGIVFPAAIVSFFYVLKLRLPRKELILSVLWGSVVALLTSAVWYLPMYLRHGWDFINEFFIQHHFQRFTSNKYKHPQPFWFFWVVLPLMTIPWLPFFLAGFWKYSRLLINNFRSRLKRDGEIEGGDLEDMAVFAIAWLLVPLVFFSVSGSKLPGYILPSLPAACVLTALFVSGYVDGFPKRALAFKGLSAATLAVILVLVAFVVPRFAVADSAKGLMIAADRAGYSRERVLDLLDIDHSLEYYAAGRLVRDTDGKQKVFRTADEIAKFAVREPGDRVLVVAHNWHVDKLADSELLHTETLATYGEWTILSAEPADRAVER
jgi:4-amino-4-deoxy-L-arabinose transferase-like glycosyltransferase